VGTRNATLVTIESMTTNRAVRAAVYCRISSDKRGDGAGVERQRDDLVKLCKTRGWESTPQLVYEDNDRSAFGAKERPAWRRMLDDADRGLIDILVAWHDDRLWRDVTEQQMVFSLLGDCGVKTIATPGRDYDTASGDDLVMSGVGALFAQKESMDKRRRLTRKMEQLARDGLWSGGFRGFGYSPDHMTINEEEAALVCDAARRIVAGESGSSIAREWNRAGVVTVTGKPWRGQALRNVLASPAITGLRLHRGEVVGDAKWPAILDRATWEAVRDAIESKPGRRMGSPPRIHLLSGWPLRCGLCGGKLRSRPRNDGVRSYVCSTEKLDGVTISSGCGGLRVVAEPLEKLVVEAVFAAFADGALDKLRATEVDHDADLRDALAQLHAAEAKLLKMEENYLLGDVSRQAYVGVRDRLTTERDGLRKQLATSRSQAFEEDLPRGADELRTWWDNANIDRKRAFMRLFFEYVTVKRAAHRGAKFSKDRIDINWLV
jgi:site-specific DNA recombinase